jgi:ATP-dependent DNA helicase RecG
VEPTRAEDGDETADVEPRSEQGDDGREDGEPEDDDDEDDPEAPDLSVPIRDLAPDAAELLASAGLETLRDIALRKPVEPDRWGIPGIDDAVLRALWSELEPSYPQLAAVQLRGDEAARRDLAREEALLVQLGASLVRAESVRERGVAHPISHQFAARAAALDLGLDDGQQLVLEEIKRELRRPSVMRRIVTGEVGAGKGRIALLAAATVVEARAQVAFVSPDAGEAEDRFAQTEPLLAAGGYTSLLFTTPPARAARDALKRGEIHVVFGTPDMLDMGLEFRRLGLVVAVEREPWGAVSARHAAWPAPRPDLLVIPSVPIGARLLLTAYADHQVSVVVDAERRPARISLCRAAERETAYARVREAVGRGEQGLVLFPLVDHADAVELPEAVRLVRALEGDALAGVRVGLLHGAMPRDERMRVLEDFQHLRVQVLVCTTRIENGPRLPGATIAVVEQADRVDQFRLHRIIGFLSRARSRADVVLVVGEHAEPDAAARIQRVLDAPNGFHLTEQLVTLRGVASVVASGAAPLPALTWLDPDRDLDLVLASREEALRIVRDDPGLRRGAHRGLARELIGRWSRWWPDPPEGWTCPIKDVPARSLDPKRRRRRRRRRR